MAEWHSGGVGSTYTSYDRVRFANDLPEHGFGRESVACGKQL